MTEKHISPRYRFQFSNATDTSKPDRRFRLRPGVLIIGFIVVSLVQLGNVVKNTTPSVTDSLNRLTLQQRITVKKSHSRMGRNDKGLPKY